MKLNVMLVLLHAAEGGGSMVKVSLKVVSLVLLLAKQGGSGMAATNTKTLSHSLRREQQTCTGNFTWNACANCCGYKFTTRSNLTTAVAAYTANKAAAIITYGEINCWDVSNITDMSNLFARKYYFNETIGCWNVSSVTNMQSMFFYATKFNQTIGNWNVSNAIHVCLRYQVQPDHW